MSLLKCKAGDILVNEKTLELTILVNPDLLLEEIEKYTDLRPLKAGDYILNRSTVKLVEVTNFTIEGFKRHLQNFRLATKEEIELFRSGKKIDIYVPIGEWMCRKCSSVKELQNISDKQTESMAIERLNQITNQPLKSLSVKSAYCKNCKTLTFWEPISINFRDIETQKLLTDIYTIS
jgi:hypothetical protein